MQVAFVDDGSNGFHVTHPSDMAGYRLIVLQIRACLSRHRFGEQWR